MLELTKDDIELAKELMWRHGLTRREATCLVAYQRGISAKRISEEYGTSETLIYRRIAYAKKKLNKILRDGEI